MATPAITADELAARLDVRRDVPLAVLDVRERWEFSDGHVPDSSPLPRGLLEVLAPAVLPDRTACVVLVSGRGERAGLAAQTLLALGYPNAYRLADGLEAWRASGRPLATGWGTPGKRLGEQMAHAVPDLQADAAEVARWCADGRALLIDIRPRWEHEQGHVPGACHIPAGELPWHAAAIRSALAQGRVGHVVTHCAGRTRGIAAAALLRDLGIPQAVALRNGCMGWLLDGRALEFGSGPTAPTGAPGGDAPATDPIAPRLDADTLASRLARRDPLYVVDVRVAQAYQEGHVPGSVSLPAGQVLLESEAVLPIGALPVAVVGAGDAQSDWAASHLRALGWRDVRVLAGGIDGWSVARPLARGREPLAAGVAPLPVPAVVSADGFVADPARWDVLDVRSVGEWGIGHLAGSRCVPRGRLEREIADLRRSRRPLLLVSACGLRARFAAAGLAPLLRDTREVQVLAGGLQAAHAAGAVVVVDAPDSSMASRDTPGRVSAAVWRMPLEQTRPLMLRYLAWEEALVRASG